MKTLITFLLGTAMLVGVNSCVVVEEPQHDNGKHHGWYKNPHNPHNPRHPSTTVIIHEDEKGKGKHGHGH